MCCDRWTVIVWSPKKYKYNIAVVIEPWWRNIGSERSRDRQFNLVGKECISLKNEWFLTLKRGVGRLSRQRGNDLGKKEHDGYPGQKERQ